MKRRRWLSDRMSKKEAALCIIALAFAPFVVVNEMGKPSPFGLGLTWPGVIACFCLSTLLVGSIHYADWRLQRRKMEETQ